MPDMEEHDTNTNPSSPQRTAHILLRCRVKIILSTFSSPLNCHGLFHLVQMFPLAAAMHLHLPTYQL